MTDWKSSLRANPLEWLLESACAPIRYRVLTELLDKGREDPDVQRLRQEMMEYKPALQLEKTQKPDGSWGTSIHAGDPKKYSNSVENSVLRLFEYGWNRDMKAVRESAKVLRSFTTQKRDLKFYEFAKDVKADPKRDRYYRWFLRILSIGLLIRAGYEEEKNRLAILELLELTAGFVDNPISRQPTEEIGANHPLIRADAWNQGYPFMPDMYTIRALAFSPWLLGGEVAKMRLKKIFDYMMSKTYQELAPDLGLVRTVKGSFVKGHGIEIHTLDHYQQNGGIDELLVHLELFARLGLINRYPVLIQQFDWLQAQQGKDGKWNLPTKLMNESSRWTAMLRVEKDWRSPARKDADLTFRMLLIMKLQWERQMVMLDRRDDGYPI